MQSWTNILRTVTNMAAVAAAAVTMTAPVAVGAVTKGPAMAAAAVAINGAAAAVIARAKELQIAKTTTGRRRLGRP